MTSNYLSKHKVKLTPYGLYWGATLALCLVGLFISGYLAVSHYRVHTESSYQSFCALSRSINCDTVSQSPFSVFLGIPLAVWGMAVYSLMLILIFFSAHSTSDQRRVWTILFLVALFCSLASVGFAGLSAYFIGSWCILCIATYGINFLLAYISWITRRRFQTEALSIALARDLHFLRTNIMWSGPLFGFLGVGLMLTILWFPAYWDISPLGAAAHIKMGMTDEGNPWTGAENPAIDIVEFTDYQCFQCRKMHHHLLQLLVQHPGKIRIVHRHFPMDHEYNPIVSEPFHVGSGRMAILAVHAAYHGKFAEMNDWLFYKAGLMPGSISLAEAAAATGLDVGQLSLALQHTPYRMLLKKDIHEGLRLGIVGTPSYLIEGKVYEGSIPAEILKSVIE